MSKQTETLHAFLEEQFEKLDLYTLAITRAHGKSHPEAFKVRELYETMYAKLEEAGTDTPDLDEEFTQLRTVTNHYAVPDDVCETYAGVYEMLSEADNAYHA